MSAWGRVLAGRRPGLPAGDCSWVCAEDRRSPVALHLWLLTVPSGGRGAAPSWGRHRMYCLGQSLSRLLHLHQANTDHALDVAGQRFEVDGQPHPEAPTDPQPSQPVSTLQLGVGAFDPSAPARSPSAPRSPVAPSSSSSGSKKVRGAPTFQGFPGQLSSI